MPLSTRLTADTSTCMPSCMLVACQPVRPSSRPFAIRPFARQIAHPPYHISTRSLRPPIRPPGTRPSILSLVPSPARPSAILPDRSLAPSSCRRSDRQFVCPSAPASVLRSLLIPPFKRSAGLLIRPPALSSTDSLVHISFIQILFSVQLF